MPKNAPVDRNLIHVPLHSEPLIDPPVRNLDSQ